MASGFRIKISIDDSTGKKALLAAIPSREKTRALMENVGAALAQAFKENFLALDAEKSRYGHNFYRREGVDKTDYEVDVSGGGGVVVVRSFHMAHKLRGGVVSAVNAKALTIPVSEKAKRSNRGARDTVPDAQIGRNKRGQAFLFTKSGRGKSSKIVVHYILRKSVHHKPHGYVIPTAEKLRLALDKGVQNAQIFNS